MRVLTLPPEEYAVFLYWWVEAKNDGGGGCVFLQERGKVAGVQGKKDVMAVGRG